MPILENLKLFYNLPSLGNLIPTLEISVVNSLAHDQSNPLFNTCQV